MMERLRFVSRADAKRFVALYHSHHKAQVGEIFNIGHELDGELTAVCVVGRPVARPLCDGVTWEVTRLAVGPRAPRFTASRLLGAAWRIAKALEIQRLVSYTRIDEDGTCYRVAGWVAVETTKGRPHNIGKARSARWLPGLYEPSTEIIDRVRWEIGPGAAQTRVNLAEAREKWKKRTL
jgi:hypothetical protein